MGDVSSPLCSRRKGVRLTSLFAPDRLADSLHDNTRTPVPDQVLFRLDFPAWVGSLAVAKRRVLDRLLAGERTTVRLVGPRPVEEPARPLDRTSGYVLAAAPNSDFGKHVGASHW